jgi:hypothetical protein
MVAIVLSALAGFLLFLFGALVVAGSVWPTVPYESALPALLVSGLLGAVVAVALLRRFRAKGSKAAP